MSTLGLAAVPTPRSEPQGAAPPVVDPAGRLAADPEVAQLTAALRPQFLQDVVVVTGDPSVLGSPGCLVPGCQRASRNRQLCRSHYQRWRTTASTDNVPDWAVQQTPRGVGATPLSACRVQGCRQGSAGNGLCQVHYASWRAALRPHIDPWLTTRRPVGDRNPACAVEGCELLTESTRQVFCHSHKRRWDGQGRPELGEFLAHVSHYGEDRFDLRRLPLLLRRQIQYGLQGRVDDNEVTTTPRLLQPLLAVLDRRGVTSLHQMPVEDMVAEMRTKSRRNNSGPISFLRYTLRRTVDLQEGAGWDNEYPRDVWHLRRLHYAPRGISTRGIGGMIFRFDRIEQLWLRQLGKRWMRQRLSAGLKPVSLVHQLRALEELSASLSQPGPAAGATLGPADLDREAIERFLAGLPSRFSNSKTRSGMIGAVATFLRAVRQFGWTPELPVNATIYADDYPKHELSRPRSLSEYVMAQLEDPANLDRWRRPENRLVTQILMATGLRVGDACALAPDCLAHDHDGAPYLRYRNHKMRRDAVVPVSTELAAAIEQHQQVMRATVPTARYLLLAAVANPDGTRPMSTAGYRNSLRDWLAACAIHDEHGRALHVTPHQWRHTYGTRLINSEVPQEVVRRLLDHSSHQMTSHYARLTDRTIRQQWERARKVDSSGRDITAQVDSPHADADWMKHNLARAKMALPNGYCGLPLQQSCPHANACLTCPVFITTPQFLPQHHEHLAATRRLIATAEADGQFRLVEMNQQVAGNLERVIATLDQPERERES